MRMVTTCVLVAAVVTVSTSEVWLETRAARRPEETALLYLPSGRFLQAAALGYRTFLADLIYLWSIQYYSTYTEGTDRFRFLEHIYGTVIPRLDAKYVDPYLVGALITVVEKHDLEGALRLLDQGIAANPEAWILSYEAGFWAYDVGHDYDRAARYFERALASPGAPAHTRRMRAEMFNRKGDKETSLYLWSEILSTADDDRVAAIAEKHVHDLTIDVDIARLEKAIDAYRQRRGRPPLRLAALVRDRLIDVVPLDPDGVPYAYDPSTGKVTSATPFRLRRP
ncbi:MAG: tetratricopeptide repeat protein [Acidobacteriota bacterium]